MKINLIDKVFSHDKFSVAGRESKFIEWDRTLSNPNLPIVFSHEFMFYNPRVKQNSYGLLIESRAIIPEVYKHIESHLSKFEKVFTHNSDFLKKYNNCFWIPGGGVWVGGKFSPQWYEAHVKQKNFNEEDLTLGEMKIFDKKRLCSLVSSNKTMCYLHYLRLNISSWVTKYKVDVFGLDKFIPINKSLEDYMFSIVVENYQDDMYFTEKILNCFATGTIPIYLGAKNIGEKFDLNGIIQFNSDKDLKDILKNLSPDDYYKRLQSIKNNFELCKNYIIIEDYIYNEYLK